ncbi:MBL fold metallo-hydrolase [Halorussus sp. AFM4]|uniref:MBL fold metallo-hydrolase n=1 Tax=Halorussus sp. AFM4 TaxID=3421651 RepID=UPI003EC0B698
MTVRELRPGVYDLTCRDDDRGRYRAFLFDADVPTLVDTGIPEGRDALLDGLAETGLDPGRVVLTHADWDHVGGVAAVVDAYDPEVWVPEQSDVSFAPDRRYGDGDAVGPFEAVHAPGHTADSHALVDEDRGVAVLGDAAIGSDRRGLPAGYLVLPEGEYSDDLVRAEESLARLLAHEFDAALVYHGSSVLADAGEKLDAFVNFPGKESER